MMTKDGTWRGATWMMGAMMACAIGCAPGADDTPSDGAPDRAELADSLSAGKADDATIDGLCARLGAPAGCDLCQEMNLYDDGVCDDFCPTRDADCGAPARRLEQCDPADLEDAGFFTTNYTLNAARVEDGELVASLSFGGGCQEHDFALCWDGDATTGQADVFLGHNANGDFCEAFLTQEVRFDLTAALGETPMTLAIFGHDTTVTYGGGASGGGGDLPPADAVSVCGADQVQALEDAGFRREARIVDTMAIAGDRLDLSLRFGGGCQEHDFRVCWDGAVLESLPPQANLTLWHQHNDDFCEALLSEQLSLDLGAFGTDGEILLNLGDEQVLYTP